MSLQSLKEAVLEIVEDMEKDAEEGNKDHIDAEASLRSYAKQLKRACKAAGDDPPPPAPIIASQLLPGGGVSPAMQHALEVEKYREEFRKAKEHHKKEEELLGGNMVEIEGTNPPEYVAINPEMPEGAFTQIDGRKYVLRGKKLHLAILRE